MIYKYLISDSTDPYHNLALEQLLFDHCEHDSVILYLWQNNNTIVIGKNQEPYNECRVDEFLRDNGRIARRRSGGGAVFHDLGNLNFSIICHNDCADKADYRDIIIGALKSLDVTAEYNGRNDIMTDNGKFSGNANYSDGKILCQHGTVLIASDIGKMTRYLTPDEKKLERNAVKSVSARVTNLSEIYPHISVDCVRQAMIAYTGAVKLEADISSDKLSALTEHYSSHDWIYGGAL